MSAPRWTAALLRRLARPGRVDEVLGDLEEAHRRRRARRGRVAASLLTGLEALDMARALLLERRRRGDDGGGVAGRPRRRGPLVSWLDLKLGARMLRKYPGLTVAGGLAMAFAIWVGAGTFEFATQVLHPTLPLEDGDRIVGMRVRDAQRGGVESRLLYDLAVWREQLASVDELGAFRSVERNLIGPEGRGEPVGVAEMSAAGFRVARVPPLLGRTLVEADGAPAAPPVLVLGHEVWRSRFAGDPDIVGRTVRLGATQATVVGVMPEGFAFPVAHGLWMPLRLDAEAAEPRQGPGINVFGRLAPGATLEEAQTELTALGRRLAAAHPDTHEHLRPQVLPYARAVLGMPVSYSVGITWTNLFLMMLLGVVCGNVALLMFARAATREGEIVVRSALGASRGRIVGQLFAEALVLGGLAAVVGLSAAGYGLNLGFAVVRAEVLEGGRLPFWFQAGLSPATVAYAAVLTVLAAVVAGVLPALKVTGRGVENRLKETGAGAGGVRFGGIWTAVIVGQVAVTVAFPATGYFLRRTMIQIEAMDVGFPEEEYLSVRLEMDRPDPTAAADGNTDPARRFIDGIPARAGSGDADADAAFRRRFRAAVHELEARLELEPRVVAVAVADRLPRMYHPWKQIEVDEGAVAPPDERGHRVSNAAIAHDYFDVLDTRLVAGRGFDEGDVEAGSRVVVANEAFVETVLGGKNAIGRRIRYVDADWWDAEARTAEDWYTIVGVAPDLAMTSGYGVAGLYHPVAAAATYPLHLAIRVQGRPETLAPRLRELATAVDPTLRLNAVVPVDELDASELLLFGFWLRMVAIVSGVAMLLALTGIYAVMAYTVSRRTREIGIRVALGAPARRVVLSIFARPLTQVAVGIALGATWTLFLSYAWVGSTAEVGGEGQGGFSAGSAGVVAAYAVLMTAVCLTACVVPTRRALRVEPTEALRSDG